MARITKEKLERIMFMHIISKLVRYKERMAMPFEVKVMVSKVLLDTEEKIFNTLTEEEEEKYEREVY